MFPILFMNIKLERAKCFHAFITLNLFSLTSSCGPQSRIEGQEQSFSTSYNTYLFSICDPDCEKTETFKKVIEPVTQAIYQQTRKKIQIKKYKHDGIQTH